MIDENGVAQNEVPAEEIPAAEPVPAPAKTCVQCGAPMEAEQLFCSACGYKNDIPVAPVPDAIAQFNAGLQQQTQKKKNLGLVIGAVVAAVVLVVAGFFGVRSSLQGKADAVIESIQAGNIETAVTQYEALGGMGENMFRQDIVDAFVAKVKADPYKNESGNIIDSSAVLRYMDYQKLATAIGISSADGTNVMEYINAVADLAQYAQYCGVVKCMLASGNDYVKVADYIKKAADSSYYTAKLYVSYANTYAKSALSKAQNNSDDSDMCKKYIDALTVVQTQVGRLNNGYSTDASAFGDAAKAITNLINECSDVTSKVAEAVKALPAIN